MVNWSLFRAPLKLRRGWRSRRFVFLIFRLLIIAHEYNSLPMLMTANSDSAHAA